MATSITRSRGETHRTEALAGKLAAISTPCVGCRNCRGLCRALIEAIVIPDLILSRADESR